MGRCSQAIIDSANWDPCRLPKLCVFPPSIANAHTGKYSRLPNRCYVRCVFAEGTHESNIYFADATSGSPNAVGTSDDQEVYGRTAYTDSRQGLPQ